MFRKTQLVVWRPWKWLLSSDRLINDDLTASRRDWEITRDDVVIKYPSVDENLVKGAINSFKNWLYLIGTHLRSATKSCSGQILYL